MSVMIISTHQNSTTWKCRSLSDRLFNALISLIGKPNIQYTYTNYSGEMALVSYRSAKGAAS